jgi:hypothetical protein
MKMPPIQQIVQRQTPLEDFGDMVHYEGLKNGFEDLMIPFHGHKMATGLATSVDRNSCRKSKKV